MLPAPIVPLQHHFPQCILVHVVAVKSEFRRRAVLLLFDNLEKQPFGREIFVQPRYIAEANLFLPPIVHRIK